ncbi:MAG: thioredoxin family protein [Bacilli bacterium]|nr:thioredoxin family protein [Bacilli bacterium]
MKNNKAGIIMIIIGIVLIVGFLGYRVYVGNFRSIASENLGTALNDVDYSIVHIGELSEEKEKLLKDTIDDTRIEVYISSFDNIEDLNKFLSSYELEAEMLDSYLIMTNGNVDAVINGNVEEWRFKELVRWYFFNEIPTSEISYKVPESAREYEQIINRNKYTVTVFGFAGCTHCNLYLPNVNDLAADYGLDIYYFDRDKDINLWEDVVDLSLDIPAKCVTSGKATTTSGYFAKPMTLITKKGKTVDCIKGNVKKEELEAMLRKYGIIKEKKK